MRSILLDYAFSVLAFYKTAAGLRVKSRKFGSMFPRNIFEKYVF